MKVHLLVIDPQIDFMDLPGSALPVTGANDDMNRLADFVDKYGKKLEDIHVTLDSHQVIDIAHPAWWKGADGKMVAPFTLITAADVKAGIYTPRNPAERQRSLEYCEELERKGNYMLLIWPPHCLVGTQGHSVQRKLSDALVQWQADNYARVDFVVKGFNPYTEHYGGLMAEVPDPTDPTTQLNTGLLETLQQADEILIAGEASSHCVLSTVNQIVDNIGGEHVKKIKLMTDCMSPVGHNPGGPDFPAIAAKWLIDIQKKGVGVTTSTTYFS
jgi:nicotinamidase/pyrazinamidase